MVQAVPDAFGSAIRTEDTEDWVQADRYTELESASAGDIVAVVGPKAARVGASLCAPDAPEEYVRETVWEYSQGAPTVFKSTGHAALDVAAAAVALRFLDAAG